MVLEAIQSQAPRETAVRLIRSEYVADPELFVSALLNWCLVHVDVIDEFEELLVSPKIMLADIAKSGRTAGDCDDMAMLSASILASVGALVQLVAVFPQPDGSYAHVFTRYKFPRQSEWADFDPTIGYNQGSYPPDILTVDIIS